MGLHPIRIGLCNSVTVVTACLHVTRMYSLDRGLEDCAAGGSSSYLTDGPLVWHALLDSYTQAEPLNSLQSQLRLCV